MKRIEKIPYETTGRFSQLILDYLAGQPQFKELVNQLPNQIDWTKQMSGRSFTHRSQLTAILTRQNSGSPSPLTLRHIALLESENTFTITTGHQACLFLGPLYTIFKIANAINLCKRLSREYPDKNFVPVFWLHDEDHDFEEIASTSVYGKVLNWEREAAGPVGRMSTEGLDEVITRLRTLIENEPKSEELLTLIQDAYSANNYSTATRKLVAGLFADYGLVILNQDDPELKALFRTVMVKEAKESFVSEEVAKADKVLLDNGYKTQAKPRPINLFHLQEESRALLFPDAEGIRIGKAGEVFTAEALIEKINEVPGDFGPNVLLRPVYQEMVLPNLAYIGGGGELAYWMQTRPIFNALDIPFPILLLRTSVLFVDRSSNRLKEKLGLTTSDLFLSAEEQTRKIMDSKGPQFSIEEELSTWSDIYEGISQKILGIDNSLGSHIERVRKEQGKLLRGLEKKVSRRIKEDLERELNQLHKLRNRLFPQGNLQERVEGFIPHYLQFGRNFIDEMVHQLDVLDMKFMIVFEDE